MRFKLDTKYSEQELQFVDNYHCEILSEIKLSNVHFSEHEIPRRMLKYCGTYVAEIRDDESDDLVWAVLSKWKGAYHISSYYDSLDALAEGL